MPSNNTGAAVRDLHARFPSRVGSLMSPGGWRQPFGEFAIDNGAFPAFTNGTAWSARAFMDHLEKVYQSGRVPLWVAAPDVVGDRLATLKSWHHWGPKLRAMYGWPVAFVIQDNMEASDIPAGANALFVGGSTAWKWRTLPTWTWVARELGVPLHVGRVNSGAGLWRCDELGVTSCDGTGWTRGNQTQWNELVEYLEASDQGERRRREMLYLTPEH